MLQSLQRPGRGVEQQLEELRRENGQLRDQLKNEFTKELGDDALSREVSAIRDPGSFAAVKTILARMTKQSEEIKKLNQQIVLTGDVQKNLADLATKNKQKETEIKTYQAEIKSLMRQNDFLLREYNFLQKKQAQGKTVGPVVASKDSKSDQQISSPEFYQKCVQEICNILKIKDESKLVNSVKIIEEAYQLLPSLQNTVENIFKIVYNGNIFDTPLNSYDDLSDAVENWATNLQDYKNLVDGLLEILEVEEEENKTLETISRLKSRSGAASYASKPDVRNRDAEEAFMMLKEMLRENSKEGVLDSVASMQKRLNTILPYLQDIKLRLGVSESSSDEVTFSKLMRFIGSQQARQ